MREVIFSGQVEGGGQEGGGKGIHGSERMYAPGLAS